MQLLSMHTSVESGKWCMHTSVESKQYMVRNDAMKPIETTNIKCSTSTHSTCLMRYK